MKTHRTWADTLLAALTKPETVTPGVFASTRTTLGCSFETAASADDSLSATAVSPIRGDAATIAFKLSRQRPGLATISAVWSVFGNSAPLPQVLSLPDS